MALAHVPQLLVSFVEVLWKQEWTLAKPVQNVWEI
jgi:hypothetical protein